MSDNNTPWPAPVPQPPSFDPTFPGPDGRPVDNSRLAGFWMRFGAHVIDNLTIALVNLPFRLASDSLDKSGNSGPSSLVYIAGVVVSLYAYSYWTGVRGGTPLRCRLGVYIVDQDSGSFIGMRRGLIRILMSYVSALAVLIGYFWMLGNPRKQTWHDIVAKSVVIQQ